MSNAAQAYARAAQSTSSPREIEAQALMKAARKLQDAANLDASLETIDEALVFNRKLWSIFVNEAMRDDNPQPVETRQGLANLGIFVLSQSAALQVMPEPAKIQSLIDINRNVAAGLSGRA
jgi:flagellar protein FlaF